MTRKTKKILNKELLKLQVFRQWQRFYAKYLPKASQQPIVNPPESPQQSNVKQSLMSLNVEVNSLLEEVKALNRKIRIKDQELLSYLKECLDECQQYVFRLEQENSYLRKGRSQTTLKLILPISGKDSDSMLIIRMYEGILLYSKTLELNHESADQLELNFLSMVGRYTGKIDELKSQVSELNLRLNNASNFENRTN